MNWPINEFHISNLNSCKIGEAHINDDAWKSRRRLMVLIVYSNAVWIGMRNRSRGRTSNLNHWSLVSVFLNVVSFLIIVTLGRDWWLSCFVNIWIRWRFNPSEIFCSLFDPGSMASLFWFVRILFINDKIIGAFLISEIYFMKTRWNPFSIRIIFRVVNLSSVAGFSLVGIMTWSQ